MKSKAKHPIKPNDVPFGITDAPLAFALDLGGIPPAAIPVANRYTEEQLFEIGGGKRDAKGNVIRNSRFQGDDIVEAAKAAFAEKKPGTVIYRFQRSKNLERLCKAYNDEASKLKHGDKVNTTERAFEIAEAIVDGTMEKDEAIVRLSALTVKTYVSFKRMWEGAVPEVKVDNEGEPREFETTAQTVDKNGNRQVVPARGFKMPGFRTMSVNAPSEVRKKLRI